MNTLIEHTFIHIQGIGKKIEQKLWERGILTWNHFLDCRETIFSPARDQAVELELEASLVHRDDVRFFSERLSLGDMWRVFGAFKAREVYLDIETSGGYQGMDEITVIGLYDGHGVQSFVNGINLDEFEVCIAQYDLIITFNGACFDLPFIRRWYPNISLPPAHIDLRFLLKRLGYQGGLKRIEKDLGLVRDLEINGMDGYDAVMLWRAYQWGDHSALDRLVRYNTADIVNLKPLMEMAYKEMKAETLSFVGRGGKFGWA